MTTPFNWLSYLDVAEHLFDQGGPAIRAGDALGPEQRFYRSAISRAYYGVLCHTRDTLQPLRDTPFSSRGDVHQQVIDALRNDPRPEVVHLGDSLSELRKERNRVDYRTRLRFGANRVRSALAMAREIRDGITALFL